MRVDSVQTLSHFNELARSWISNIHSDEQQKGYRYVDNATEETRHLTFTQVLLRSNAIEELLAALACDSGMRAELGTAWKSVKEDYSPDASPSSERTHASSEVSNAQLAASLLYQLLSKTLLGNESVWFGLVMAFVSPHGHDDEMEVYATNSVDNVSILSRCERAGFRSVELPMLTQLKRDWLDDWLEGERRDLATNLDLKRSEFLEGTAALPAGPEGGRGSNEPMWLKIKISGDLVDLYESVKDNLDVCTMRRAEARKEIVSLCAKKLLESKKAFEGAKVERAKSVERQKTVGENSRALEAILKPKLEAVTEERSAIDSRISKLETEKQRLKMELERVCGDLADAQTVQRSVMDAESNLRTEIDISRSRFASMLAQEVKLEKEEQVDLDIHEKLGVTLAQLSTNIDIQYTKSSSDLAEIYTQFDNAFLEAVQEHMTVLSAAIQDVNVQVKRLCDELDSVNRAKSSRSFSSMLNARQKNSEENEEFDASAERLNVKFFEIENKLRFEASVEVDKFSATFRSFHKRFESKFSSNRLLNGEVHKINDVLQETQTLIAKYTSAEVLN